MRGVWMWMKESYCGKALGPGPVPIAMVCGGPDYKTSSARLPPHPTPKPTRFLCPLASQLQGTKPSLPLLPCSFSFSLNQPAEQQIISLGLGREATLACSGQGHVSALTPYSRMLSLFIAMATSLAGRSVTCQGVLSQLGYLRPRWVSWGGGEGGVQAAPTHDSFF